MVIPNAVDASHFINVQEFSRPKLMAGRLQWSHPVGRLQIAESTGTTQAEIDRLASKFNRRRAGVGDYLQRDALQEWASRYGQNRVQLLGWRSDIAPLMASSRLASLPSRH